MTAPPANIVSDSRRGMTSQTVSSRMSPWIGTPTSPGVFRLYLKKKKITAAVMATAKNRQIAVMYTIRASTLGAKLDACSGYSGSCDCTALVCSLRFRFERVIASSEDQNPRDDRENRKYSAKADDAKNRGAVARGRRIVLEAIQQEMVDRTSDLSGRGVDQAESHVARRIFHSVEIARDSPVGSEQHDAACVRENVRLRVERIAEIRGVRQRVNRILCAGQEVPACRRLRALKMSESRRFLLPCHIGRFARIEADEYDFVIRARIERKHLQRTDDALLDLIAEHRAAVVHERQQHWLAVEIIAERNVFPRFVLEAQRQRNLSIERRVKSHVAQSRRKPSRS